jgi:hypothetical protein
MDEDDECLGHVQLNDLVLNTHVGIPVCSSSPVENIHQKISMCRILQPQFNSCKL